MENDENNQLISEKGLKKYYFYNFNQYNFMVWIIIVGMVSELFQKPSECPFKMYYKNVICNTLWGWLHNI